jgi:integrase
MALNKIDDKDLIDYRAQRLIEPVIKRGKKTAKLTSPTTVNKELGLLRKLMRLARPKGFIKAMPAFEMDREPSRERRLTAEEYSKLLEGSPAWLRRVCIAAFETALSRSDLLGLTWKEIDQKTNVIVLEDGRDKTKVRQEIPIRTESLIELFAELKAESKKLPNIDELVFTRDGRRIKPMQLRRALQRACKAAKIEGFTFHDFRHCAITRWHAMSVPVSVAMIMSGHTSVQSHKKYVNLRTQEVAEVFTGCLQRNSELQKKSASA